MHRAAQIRFTVNVHHTIAALSNGDGDPRRESELIVSLAQHGQAIHLASHRSICVNEHGALQHILADALLQQIRAMDSFGNCPLNMLSRHRRCTILVSVDVGFAHDIRDLPIVDETGRLVGIASRVDIGAAYLAPWTRPEQPT